MAIQPQGLQALNPKIVNFLQKTNLQLKNRWDFILFRTPFNQQATSSLNQITNITDIAGIGSDLAVAKVYVQSIMFNPVLKFIPERINGDVYVRDLEYQESVNIKFLDDERGLVMRYLQDWYNDIAFPSSVTSTKEGWIFRDGQERARRTGILLLQGGAGKFPGTYPRITMYGLFPMNFSDITISQDEKENLIYDVNFSVREVRTSRLL